MGTEVADANVKMMEKLSFCGAPAKWEAFRNTFHNRVAESRVDKVCPDWVLEAGAIFATFLANKTKDKALARSKVAQAKPIATDPTKYKEDELSQHFGAYQIGVTLKLSLHKVKKETLGNNFADAQALGFTEAELKRSHLALSVQHLHRVNRFLVGAMHDSVFKNPPQDAPGRVKLHSILKTTTVHTVTEILTNPRQVTQAVEQELEEWVTKPWLMPAVFIWGQIIHKYQGMTEMIQGTFVQEFADIINHVANVPQQKRITIYAADEMSIKYGELLVNHFPDTKTMWEFFRASLRQYHIRQLSKVGKEKEAWKKADEYLTELLESDTLLTLDHTREAMKRAESYMQRELRDKNDNNPPPEAKLVKIDDENKEAAAFQALETQDDENEALKARVAALEAQLSSGQDNAGGGGRKRKKQAAKQTASKDKPKCAEMENLTRLPTAGRAPSAFSRRRRRSSRSRTLGVSRQRKRSLLFTQALLLIKILKSAYQCQQWRKWPSR